VVEAILRLMDTDRAVGEVVNIGNDHEITMEELAAQVIQRTGSASAVHYIPYDQAYEPGFEDMARRVPSLEKLIRLTDFRPSTPLPVIIDKVAAYIAARTPETQSAQA
jgi:UDP-glucose 4-epimerase